jgi:toxin ParE1/3/4
VPHLVYRAAARRDIAEIAAYIERENQSRAVAEAFIDKITSYCEHLATLPTMMGRPRPELRGNRIWVSSRPSEPGYAGFARAGNQ